MLFLNIIISSLRNTSITLDSPPMVLDGVMTHLIENTNSEEVCKFKGDTHTGGWCRHAAATL